MPHSGSVEKRTKESSRRASLIWLSGVWQALSALATHRSTGKGTPLAFRMPYTLAQDAA